MLEKMSDFFAARVEGYDEHMLENVEGCREGYILMAALLPENAKNLLDLGCGTGLELDEIFKLHQNISVTGIDLTEAMLEKFKKKHPDKNLRLICGDYFKTDFGTEIFDCAVSFESLHHFSHELKTALYKKIYNALSKNGIYIECDYMVETQSEEDFFFSENRRFRKELGSAENEYFHFDTPCTIKNQITMLKAAGFKNIEQVFRKGGTVMLVSKK